VEMAMLIFAKVIHPRVAPKFSQVTPPPFPPPSEGEGVKKLKKVGRKMKKILDYTFDYMLSSFYPTGRRRRFPWDT